MTDRAQSPNPNNGMTLIPDANMATIQDDGAGPGLKRKNTHGVGQPKKGFNEFEDEKFEEGKLS